MLQKFAGPLVGPLFVGAPVQPNILNMPKSASVYICPMLAYQLQTRANLCNV